MQILTLIIAVVGLVLSLINTLTNVYKEFFRKPPKPYLDVYCDFAYWRYPKKHDKTECQIQIDLTVVPRVQANMIKKITFINKKYSEVFKVFDENSNYVNFYKIEENLYGEKIFSTHSFNELKELITITNQANRRDVRNINLPENFAYSFTLCEKFDGARYPDGYEDLPSVGWYIQILDSYNNTFEVPINFEIINS